MYPRFEAFVGCVPLDSAELTYSEFASNHITSFIFSTSNALVNEDKRAAGD